MPAPHTHGRRRPPESDSDPAVGWYAVSDDGDSALRIVPGLSVGEWDSGALALNPADPARRWIEFELGGDDARPALLARERGLSVDGRHCRQHMLDVGARVRLPNNTLVISRDIRRPAARGPVLRVVEARPEAQASRHPARGGAPAPGRPPGSDEAPVGDRAAAVSPRTPPASEPGIVAESTSRAASAGWLLRILPVAALLALAGLLAGLLRLADFDRAAVSRELGQSLPARHPSGRSSRSPAATDAAPSGAATAEQQAPQAGRSGGPPGAALGGPVAGIGDAPARTFPVTGEHPVTESASGGPTGGPGGDQGGKASADGGAASEPRTDGSVDQRPDWRLERARDALAAGRITYPPGDNAVDYLERLLADEPGNTRAMDMLGECTTTMIDAAVRAHAQGREYEARNTLEEVLGFNPRNQRARSLWRQWVDAVP